MWKEGRIEGQVRQNIETCDGEEIAIRPNQAMIDYHHMCSVPFRHKNQKLALVVIFYVVSIESGFNINLRCHASLILKCISKKDMYIIL